MTTLYSYIVASDSGFSPNPFPRNLYPRVLQAEHPQARTGGGLRSRPRTKVAGQRGMATDMVSAQL